MTAEAKKLSFFITHPQRVFQRSLHSSVTLTSTLLAITKTHWSEKEKFSHILTHLRCLVSVFVMRNFFPPSSLFPNCLRWNRSQWKRTSVVAKWKIISDSWDGLTVDCALLQFATNSKGDWVEFKSQATLQNIYNPSSQCLRNVCGTNKHEWVHETLRFIKVWIKRKFNQSDDLIPGTGEVLETSIMLPWADRSIVSEIPANLNCEETIDLEGQGECSI